jgi:hypothetical protein
MMIAVAERLLEKIVYVGTTHQRWMVRAVFVTPGSGGVCFLLESDGEFREALAVQCKAAP